jgi:hypothetical protein
MALRDVQKYIIDQSWMGKISSLKFLVSSGPHPHTKFLATRRPPQPRQFSRATLGFS